MPELNISHVNDLRSLARQCRLTISLEGHLRGKLTRAGKIIGAAKLCLGLVESALIEDGWEEIVQEDRKL